MSTACVNLQDVVSVHQSLLEHRNAAYINLIQQINTRTSAIIKDDLGSQFVQNCGRDIAGEVVRNYFDTSSYNITVDQLATRILKFSYEKEFDPLSENGGVGEVRKSVYNYNELQSAELDRISADLDASQEKLFKKVDGKYEDSYLMQKGKESYAESKTNSDGTINDEYTGQNGRRKKTSGDNPSNRQEVDHSQSANQATYNKKYLTEKGVQELKVMMNSADNFSMMEKSANASKGDVQVYEKNGKVLSQREVKEQKAKIREKLGKNATKEDVDKAFEKEAKNITSRATPEQLADAVCERWENAKNKQALIDKGYLNEDGTVPKAVRKKLIQNVRHSQNAESVVILKNTKYDEVAKDAAAHTKAAVGKIIAGQIIYYAAPPLVYEVRTILQKRHAKLENALDQLGKAAQRISNYVFSKIKDIFSNILFNSLKKFIKSFMDILIGVVKATVKKLLKIAKNLVLSTVDAVRIVADKNASPAEKADSVFNLFGVTITSCVIEVLFELAADALHIPEPFDDIVFGPLQILATVICTNLTMLILQKADLFDVRFGFKINAIKNVFAEEYAVYEQEMNIAEDIAESEVQQLLQRARGDCMSIYTALENLNPRTASAQPQLNQISKMFNVYIDYDEKWAKFIGQKQQASFEPASSISHNQFIVNYENNKNCGLAAAATYYYFMKLDPKIREVYPFDIFMLPQDVAYEAKKMSTITPFIFYEVKKHLENISDESLDSIISMVDAFMECGSGVTAAKNSARAIFDKYVATRKKESIKPPTNDAEAKLRQKKAKINIKEASPLDKEIVFSLIVEDVFATKERDTIISGEVLVGPVRFGDLITIFTSNGTVLETPVIGIQHKGILLDEALVGMEVELRIGINAKLIQIGDTARKFL